MVKVLIIQSDEEVELSDMYMVSEFCHNDHGTRNTVAIFSIFLLNKTTTILGSHLAGCSVCRKVKYMSAL